MRYLEQLKSRAADLAALIGECVADPRTRWRYYEALLTVYSEDWSEISPAVTEVVNGLSVTEQQNLDRSIRVALLRQPLEPALADRLLGWRAEFIWSQGEDSRAMLDLINEFYGDVPEKHPNRALFNQKLRERLVTLPTAKVKELQGIAAAQKQKPIAQFIQALLTIKRIVPNGDLRLLADQIHKARRLMDQLSNLYDNKAAVDFPALVKELQRVAEGQLTAPEERQAFAEECFALAQRIYDLGKEYGDNDRGQFRWVMGDDRLDKAFLEGKIKAPWSSLGLLKWMSGIIQKNKGE